LPRENLDRLLGLILLVSTIGAYWYLLHCDFIFFDDPAYVTENSRVRAGLSWQNVSWAFTTFSASNWHPLTWLSHMLDCNLYALNPAGHHLTNLLFHVGNTLLLFLFLRETTGRIGRSFVVAALFSLHPLHVESVAWVSERKDVLSIFLWMLALVAYVRYAERRETLKYLCVLFPFAIGLMAKPMMVTFPFVLLLLDYWPLGRVSLVKSVVEPGFPGFCPGVRQVPIRSIIWEKVPFFLLSLISSAITLLAQSEGGAVRSLDSLSLITRVSNALVSYVHYMFNMLWPNDLTPFYPHPGNSVDLWLGLGSALLLAALSLAAFQQALRRPYFIVGWLWYIGALVPVIGLVQVGDQALADRYTYIPLIGLFIAIVWGLGDFFESRRTRPIFVASLVCSILLVLIIVTRSQLRYWQNTTSLFEHTLRVTNHNYLAHFTLSQVAKVNGDLDKALFHHGKAVEMNSGFVAKMHNRAGYHLAEQGQLDDAISSFAEAIKVQSDYANAHNNLGVALARKAEYQEALAHFAQALRISPGNPKVLESVKNLEADMARIRASESNTHDP
jgi:protein O-mannosyl-transferase